MTLSDLFDLSLLQRRDSVGLEFHGATLAFGELDARANRMARLLESRGLRAGDRLAVYLANRVEMIDLFLAAVRLGVIFVPINILYREREIAHIVGDAQPKAVVAAAPVSGSTPTWLLEDLAREAADMPDSRPGVTLKEDAPASLVYTSGTTGASKGAVLTHANFAANAATLVTSWQITSADRFLLALPLFHVHGLGNGLHVWLASGCRMRLLERFERQSAAATFLDFRPTLFFGVPTMYAGLLEMMPEHALQIGGFMRLFVSGSAPLARRFFEGFRDRFGHEILERYGMTETLMITSNPYTGERRPGTVGMPLPGVAVKLVDGELYVHGPNVFAGYWRRDEATREAFTEGYFRTGDMAAISPDGYYTLEGRRGDLIISGGFNIYPREIEEMLLAQHGIAEVVVVGAPDPRRGEVPVAYVVACDGFNASAIEQSCREQLASFKVPRAFIPVERLPRTALGKVQKHLLPKWEGA